MTDVDAERRETARRMKEAQDRARGIMEQTLNEHKEKKGFVQKEELLRDLALKFAGFEEEKRRRAAERERIRDWAARLRFIDGPGNITDDLLKDIVGFALQGLDVIATNAIRYVDSLEEDNVSLDKEDR